MKTEFKIILEICLIILIAIIVQNVMTLIGVQTTFYQSLLSVVLCQVARLKVIFSNINNNNENIET